MPTRAPMRVSSGAFVTGGAGFAGTHLRAILPGAAAPRRSELDLLDATAVRSAIAMARPAIVFHLAALASVGRSWEVPQRTIDANTRMTLNLLEAVRCEAPGAAVVFASSGEVYGPPERLPVIEDAPLRPQNPYAASKAACEVLASQYAEAFGLQIVRMRAFHHAGPGQGDEYIVGTLTRQVAEAEAARADEVLLRTGNPDSARDFTDVRDVVRAYVAAAELPSTAFNVCSGRATSVRRLVALVSRATVLPVRHEVDSARLRTHDVPEVRGSAERLRAACGWEPVIALERTVEDALEAWRARIGAR